MATCGGKRRPLSEAVSLRDRCTTEADGILNSQLSCLKYFGSSCWWIFLEASPTLAVTGSPQKELFIIKSLYLNT